MEIASRFAKDRQVVFRKHATGGADYEVTITPSTEERFEGPVAVLIGENTVSAGETLALAMSALPGAMLIGQPTRGELSDAIPKRLPNGWSFTVSIESVLTKDGTLVEAKGVQPGVLIPKGDWASDIALALTKIRNR
jgi:carboxyl-terminal processing protease